MQMSRGEMNDLLAKFASDNYEYRNALRADARTVVQRQFNLDVPDHIQIKVVEESADTVYVVLPHIVEQGAELSDADLEQVAGGAMVKEAKCDNAFLGTVVEVTTSLF